MPKMEVTLTPEEIRDIVASHLAEKYGNNVGTIGEVKFQIEMQMKGHQLEQFEVPVFKGVKCEVKL